MNPLPRIVTAVHKRPGKGEYAIYVDGEHAADLDEEAYLRLPLREGDLFDEEQVARVRAHVALSRAKARALRMLAARARTEAQVKERLLQLGFDPEIAGAAVAWLRSLGYLDDEAFARQWVRSRVEHRPMGARRLALELRRQGVPPAIADEAAGGVTEAQETEWAFALANERLARLGHLPREKAMRRIYGLLERRGFAPRVISRVMGRLFP